MDKRALTPVVTHMQNPDAKKSILNIEEPAPIRIAETARQVMCLAPELARRVSPSLFIDEPSLTVEPCGGEGGFERVVFSFLINPGVYS